MRLIRNTQEMNRHINDLKERGETSKANHAELYRKWGRQDDSKLQFAFISALGLQRDPSRGRTHIIVRIVEYAPASKELKYKFRTKGCGVFKITDAISALEQGTGANKGEGQKLIKELIESTLGQRDSNVPMLWVNMGEGVETWFGSSEFQPVISLPSAYNPSASMSVDDLRRVPYDPNWRLHVNKPGDERPSGMGLHGGFVDVEHIF